MHSFEKQFRRNIPLYAMSNVDAKLYYDVTDFLAELLDRSGFVPKPFEYGTPAPTIERTSDGDWHELKDENGKRVFIFKTVEEFERKIKKHFYVFLK